MHNHCQQQTEENRRKKSVISYSRMVASLCALGIDLNWADNQYWCILLDVIGETVKLRTPKKKEKVSVSAMQKYIKD